jgi:antitoxin component HigA of HigAB toxin-antitoxin module
MYWTEGAARAELMARHAPENPQADLDTLAIKTLVIQAMNAKEFAEQ